MNASDSSEPKERKWGISSPLEGEPRSPLTLLGLTLYSGRDEPFPQGLLGALTGRKQTRKTFPALGKWRLGVHRRTSDEFVTSQKTPTTNEHTKR